MLFEPAVQKSGNETTSLGMSSLPTSDGLSRPAPSPGRSPEVGNPTSLARSVSAPACPLKPSDPDRIGPEALKALKASAEFQVTSEKREHLPPQDLSDSASSADSAPASRAPATPLLNSPEEAVAAENMEKSAEGSTQGLRSPPHTGQQASLSVTAAGVQEPLGAPGEKGWHPESQSPSEGNGPPQHREPGSERHEVVQQDAPRDRERGHCCDTDDSELPGEGQQNQPTSVDLEAPVKEDGLQENVDLPGTEEDPLPAGRLGRSPSETLMEVDTVEESPGAVLNSVDGQNAGVKSIGAADLTLDNPLMEVETSKCNPSSEILNNSICTQHSPLPDTNVEMSGTNKEDGGCSPPVSLCGSCQPSVGSAEEPCSSLTAALKELHELLVISSKPASENTSREALCQSEMVTEGQPGIKELSERWTQSERVPTTQRDAHLQVSFRQTVSVSVRAAALTDTSNGAGVDDAENIRVRDPGDGLVTDKESVPESRESENESSSAALATAKASKQLQCTVGVEMSPRLLAGEEGGVSLASEQTKSLSSFTLVEDLGQGAQNLVRDRPETGQDVCPEAGGPLLEFGPPTSCPLSSPSILPPLIFPAADIDRILRAGFTLQEALGALHRVGGNADLALLVLLAKNIVVPT
ncbi:regulatory solute carrier protein family 1 member 1 isoform X2 [Suricata suricatta]|uniref:regulatory solute carrier protein family 1 member 1 isoform X2 n=1 Tax=Suricata suricatta TaxID=37032 RepID=UPI001155D843|nr:regulatory solute carrier protein family 1 member 1 isoform X2 [Suricata suricatta]